MAPRASLERRTHVFSQDKRPDARQKALESCHIGRRDARPFVVSPYRIVEGEAPSAVFPRRCPWFVEGGPRCRIVFDHHRERKTGPEHRLAVLRCKVHGQGFTVYPPGHVPYGRVAIAPVTSGGALLRRGEGERGAGSPTWDRTVFTAAFDAGRGEVWVRGSPSEDSRRRRTQVRWVIVAATMLGMTDVGPREREQIAERLGLAVMDVIEAARAFHRAPRWSGRGQIVVRLLAKLSVSSSLSDVLLCCGAIAGLWGRPSRWDPGGPLGGVVVSEF